MERQRVPLQPQMIQPGRRAMLERFGVGPDFLDEDMMRRNFSSAGVLPIADAGKVLLGSHVIAGQSVWGPFAGRREGEEHPEDTALREAEEEAGLSGLELGQPVVILRRSPIGDPKIGLIFPVVVEEGRRLRVPNEEIEEAQWFDPEVGLSSLMDNENPLYQLWGGDYTFWLLRRFQSLARLYQAGPGFGRNVARSLNTEIFIETTHWSESLNPSPYTLLKKSEKKGSSK